MNLYYALVFIGALFIVAVLVRRGSSRQAPVQQTDPDPDQDPADALNPFAKIWQKVNAGGIWQQYSVRYALFFIALITGCLTFVRYEATGWYKYWPAHGVNYIWLYVLAALIGVGYVSTRPGGWGRRIGVGVPVALFLGIILWCGGLTTYDYFFGSAQERAAEKAAEKLRKEQERQAAIASATPTPGIIPQMAAGFGTALFGNRSPGANCNIPRKPHEFTTEPETLNPDPNSCTCVYGADKGETFYVWTVGKTADADKVEVALNQSTKSYPFPNNVVRIAAAYVPFSGVYNCH